MTMEPPGVVKDAHAASPQYPASIAARLLAERFRIVMRQTPRGLAATFGMAMIFVAVFRASAQSVALFGAIAWLVAAWLTTIAMYRRFSRLNPPDTAITHWVRWSLASKAFHGAGWGVLSVVAYSHSSVVLRVLDVALVFGVVTGSAVMHASLFRAAVAFAIPAMVPIVILCLWSSSPDEMSVAIAAVVGLAFTLSTGRQWERTIVESIWTRFENLDLLAELARQKDMAEAANQQKSRFLAAASHDLRQPLHALNLFLDAARATAEGPERQNIYRRVEASAANLTTLFDGLMELSRLEVGARQPLFRLTNLATMVTRLAAEFSSAAERKGLRVRVRAKPVCVETDPILCEQILRNLLSNAIRYTERGGVLLALRPRGDNVLIEIWDTGLGISEANRARIFEEFYQVGNPQRDRRLGVGLGLAIANRAAGLLGQGLQVKSREGRGSCFRFALPMVPMSEELSDPAKGMLLLDAHAALVGATIAFLDDEPDVLVAVSKILHQSGCIVYAAEDAAQLAAQLRAAERTPDVIVSDFRLGAGINGVAAVDALRAEFGAATPALLITGDDALGHSIPNDDSTLQILHKPVPAALLRQRIAGLLA